MQSCHENLKSFEIAITIQNEKENICDLYHNQLKCDDDGSNKKKDEDYDDDKNNWVDFHTNQKNQSYRSGHLHRND